MLYISNEENLAKKKDLKESLIDNNKKKIRNIIKKTQ